MHADALFHRSPGIERQASMSSFPIASNASQANPLADLFADTLDEDTIDLLTTSASRGVPASIDVLLRLALRADHLGTKAENALFDLFSGKTQADEGAAAYIQQASFKLYQTSSIGAPDKLHNPSKLLYMAGSGDVDLDTKKAISRLLTGHQQAHSAHERMEENDLWGKNRLLTTDEIHARTKTLEQHGRLSINFPIPLVNPANGENFLERLLLERIIDEQPFSRIELFPVNTGNHWVVFGIYQQEQHAQERKAFVFNSHHDLGHETRKEFDGAAQLSGCSAALFLQSNLQEHVPNGCGILVAQAMGAIGVNQDKNPVESLIQFIEDFAQHSAAQQELFNLQQRRQTYGHILP